LHFTYLQKLQFASDITKQRFLRHFAKAKRQTEEFPFWQGSFYEEEIREAKWPPIAVQWIDEIIGYGVFATEDLPAKLFIGEYLGLVCERTIFFKSNLYCMAFLRDVSSFRRFVINGEKHGNFTRFINHSSRPNLQQQTVYCQDMAHIIFITNRSIKAGEQLTFDYGERYWRQCQKIPKVL